MPPDPFAPLSAAAIHHALADRDVGSFGQQLHYHPEVGSTNDLARQLAQDGAPRATLVITDHQVAGRGRMGRRWVAPPNTALLMSLLFRPKLPPAEANRLVMAVGLSACEAIEGETGLSVSVKWPNDLQIGGGKVAGILPESGVLGDSLDYVVVGMGINANLRDDPTADLLYPATSLLRELGKPIDRLALLAAILERLHHWNALLDADPLDEAWAVRMVTLGQRVTAGDVSGVAQRLDRSGALWLRTANGDEIRLTAGEVTLRPPDPKRKKPPS